MEPSLRRRKGGAHVRERKCRDDEERNAAAADASAAISYGGRLSQTTQSASQESLASASALRSGSSNRRESISAFATFASLPTVLLPKQHAAWIQRLKPLSLNPNPTTKSYHPQSVSSSSSMPASLLQFPSLKHQFHSTPVAQQAFELSRSTAGGEELERLRQTSEEEAHVWFRTKDAHMRSVGVKAYPLKKGFYWMPGSVKEKMQLADVGRGEGDEGGASISERLSVWDNIASSGSQSKTTLLQASTSAHINETNVIATSSLLPQLHRIDSWNYSGQSPSSNKVENPEDQVLSFERRLQKRQRKEAKLDLNRSIQSLDEKDQAFGEDFGRRVEGSSEVGWKICRQKSSQSLAAAIEQPKSVFSTILEDKRVCGPFSALAKPMASKKFPAVTDFPSSAKLMASSKFDLEISAATRGNEREPEKGTLGSRHSWLNRWLHRPLKISPFTLSESCHKSMDDRGNKSGLDFVQTPRSDANWDDWRISFRLKLLPHLFHKQEHQSRRLPAVQLLLQTEGSKFVAMEHLLQEHIICHLQQLWH